LEGNMSRRSLLAAGSAASVAIVASSALAGESPKAEGANDKVHLHCVFRCDQDALSQMSDDDARKFFSETGGDVLFSCYQKAKSAANGVRNVPRGPDVSVGCTGTVTPAGTGVSCTGSVTWHL
jgi:hypothetical protein